MPQIIHRHSEGIFIIAATPFCDNGSLDLASTDSMIDFYLESGVSGITILGIMGEAPKLGDIQGAEDLFDLYLPMVRYEQQLGIGLAIRKEILRRRGILSSAKVRSPGPSLTEKDHAELTYLMERLRRKLEGFS